VICAAYTWKNMETGAKAKEEFRLEKDTQIDLSEELDHGRRDNHRHLLTV
jgi:hypothetical protein